MKKVLIVVGTRPNFIKVTQFKKKAVEYPALDIKIVHTGQHFDEKMADVFFRQLELIPDFFLNIPSGSPNFQMAEIMIRLENLIKNEFTPDIVLVVGDVNSTLAAALTANKLGLKLGHIESGLRSYDRSMPEEINRILTDEITDLFFVTETSGYNNLIKEGKIEAQIFTVGNTMIDTMVAFDEQIENSDILKTLNLVDQEYVLMTMHRPATVDDLLGLNKLLEIIENITAKYKIVFPIHPRTLKNVERHGLLDRFGNNPHLFLTEPLDYFSFQKLIKSSKFILTDSGGIQEESTFMKTPCLTLRPNTERPITCDEGTNTLVPFNIDLIREKILLIENGDYKKGKIPVFWDGRSTDRILSIISALK